MYSSFTGSFSLGRRKKFVSAAPSKTWSGVTAGLMFHLLDAPSSGSTWTDASGNGHHATLQGAPTYVSTNGGGIKLNNSTYGGTDYISVPTNIYDSTVTIEMVASWNPTSNWATIWGNDAYSNSSGYYAYMGSATSMIWGKVPGNQSVTISASNSIRHWVWVINGASYSLYLNGSQVGTTVTQTPAQLVFPVNNFYFGARHTNAGTGATDKMNNTTAANQPVFYQMRLYDVALSASDVTTNYSAVKSSVTGGYGLP